MKIPFVLFLLMLLSLSSLSAQKIKQLPSKPISPPQSFAPGCRSEKCPGARVLNISTGIDPQTGAVLPAGTVDPAWQLANIPPFTPSAPINAALPTTYVVSAPNQTWNAIDGAGILSPINSRMLNRKNADNNQPWRFKRSFCLCSADRVRISGIMRADDFGAIKIYDAPGNLLYSKATLPGYAFNTDMPFDTTLDLPAGGYSIEFEMVNVGGASGFSINGRVESVERLAYLQGATRGCCRNTGFITVQKYLEKGNCNGRLDEKDVPGEGWSFVLKDANGNTLQTQTTNGAGQAFFTGLTSGSYTVEEQYSAGYIPSAASGSTQQAWIKADNGTALQFFNCADDRTFCCPGENLVQNPSFEYGNTSFSSEFIYANSLALGETQPGKYNIVTGEQAAAISNNWQEVQDPSTCSSTKGLFLVVNGQTGGSPLERNGEPVPAKKVVWEQAFTINTWGTYKFCFMAKNLEQYGFPTTPVIDVLIENGGEDNNLLNQVIDSQPTDGKCDWKLIERGFNFNGTGSSALTIKIVLHQTEHGDGNDLALDDIALIALPRCPQEVAEFTTTATPQATHFTVNVDAQLSRSCNKGAWAVCPLDPASLSCEPNTEVYNPSTWWSEDTNFPGYDGQTATLSGSAPGKFQYNTFYKIKHGVFGECNAWSEHSIIIYVPQNTNRVVQYTEKEFAKRKAQILRELNAQ